MPWFQNIGQVIQLVATLAGVLISGFVAWPAISQSQFLAAAPIVFYLLLIAAAAGIAFILRPRSLSSIVGKDAATEEEPFVDPGEYLSSSANVFEVAAACETFTIAKGDQWKGGSGLLALELIYHDLKEVEGGAPRADLEIRSLSNWVGGSLTSKSGAASRYLVPATRSEHKAEQACLFSFTVKSDFLQFNILRVVHINPHSGAITVILCRGRGVA